MRGKDLLRGRRCIILLLFQLFALHSKAQPFEYGIRFDAFFDNRETSREFGTAQTLGGTRIAGDVGTVLDRYHKIRLGVDGLYEFGTTIDEMSAALILYYEYDHGEWDACFGAFPRRDRLNYPVALLSDTIQYYRPNIEGGYIKYTNNTFNQGLWIDWDGSRSDERRESFNAGLSGKWTIGKFFLEDFILMSHLSGTWEESGVIDNGGYLFSLGYNLSRPKAPFQGAIKAGYLGSYYRQRSVMPDMQFRSSFYSNLSLHYRWFGADITYKQGDKMNLSLGESYYNNTKRYGKADLIFKFINKKKIRGQAILGFQYADGTFDTQQRVLISYVFSDL